MKLVIFGLSMSSSWGNGHATLWRGLCRALVRRGHDLTFFERDVPYYAAHRDLEMLPGMSLVLYPEWEAIRSQARNELQAADVAITTSYCPDASAALELVRPSRARSVFYDLDSPITIERLERGEPVDYLPPEGLAEFDLVLSYAGGKTLEALRSRLGARRTAPLYGSVDPEIHRPTRVARRPHAALSYMGTYSEDRQSSLEELFLQPAALLPDRRFLLAGSQYPADFPWRTNIDYVHHLPPSEHSGFFQSARLTLNITRAPMVRSGFCPSGRLFEAAACGNPMLTDHWDGIGEFYDVGSEILVARSTEQALVALDIPDEELDRLARRARERTLSCHTSDHRAGELEDLLEALA